MNKKIQLCQTQLDVRDNFRAEKSFSPLNIFIIKTGAAIYHSLRTLASKYDFLWDDD